MGRGGVDPRTRASLLWGTVGGLAFLVLVQAYHLLGGAFVGITVMGGTALLVTVVTAASAHVLRQRLGTRRGPAAENESS